MGSGNRNIVIIVAIGVLVIALVVFAIFFFGGPSSDDVAVDDVAEKRAEAIAAGLLAEGWRDDLVANPDQTLEAIVDDPKINWANKHMVFVAFVEHTDLTPAECQQLPRGDTIFLAEVQKSIDAGQFSEGMRAYLVALLDIARRYGIDDNEWDDHPEAKEEGNWLNLEHKVVLTVSDAADASINACLYPDVDFEVDYRPGEDTTASQEQPSEADLRNTRRRIDLNAIRGQLTSVFANSRAFPDNSGFDSQVLAQVGQQIYQDKDSETVLPLLANGTSESKIYYINEDRRLNAVAINADNIAAEIVKVALPAPAELHILVGFGCGRHALVNGNQKAGDAQPYAPGDLEVANSRTVAFVYQLEGETQARCDDNL